MTMTTSTIAENQLLSMTTATGTGRGQGHHRETSIMIITMSHQTSEEVPEIRGDHQGLTTTGFSHQHTNETEKRKTLQEAIVQLTTTQKTGTMTTMGLETAESEIAHLTSFLAPVETLTNRG